MALAGAGGFCRPAFAGGAAGSRGDGAQPAIVSRPGRTAQHRDFAGAVFTDRSRCCARCPVASRPVGHLADPAVPPAPQGPFRSPPAACRRLDAERRLSGFHAAAWPELRTAAGCPVFPAAGPRTRGGRPGPGSRMAGRAGQHAPRADRGGRDGCLSLKPGHRGNAQDGFQCLCGGVCRLPAAGRRPAEA